ncbi:hypothetical protein BD311DRAFT_92726 [Dichomitus squalens]|uniref:Uncharacterized protein n=1 Tax=Dichomitus squalens TaxID=114155 RepID=A0A4Q9M9T3_9APHY|nr:hypothetical protein BD311DRAFT_92726 [Dichomitus squalens]
MRIQTSRVALGSMAFMPFRGSHVALTRAQPILETASLSHFRCYMRCRKIRPRRDPHKHMVNYALGSPCRIHAQIGLDPPTPLDSLTSAGYTRPFRLLRQRVSRCWALRICRCRCRCLACSTATVTVSVLKMHQLTRSSCWVYTI